MNEHWQIFLALLGVVAAWGIIMVSLFKVMFNSSMKLLGDKLDEKIKGITSIADECEVLKKDLNQLKIELPLAYVRREDFIRFDLNINSKLDKLRDLVVEAIQDKGKKHD
jgi:hypothetical protein